MQFLLIFLKFVLGNSVTNWIFSGNSTLNSTVARPKIKYPITVHMPHNHTKYSCDVNGRIEEECFICDCENHVIIEEHCYKSDAANCTDVKVPYCIKPEKRLYSWSTFWYIIILFQKLIYKC